MKKTILILLLVSTWARAQVTTLPGKNGGTGKANANATLEFLGDSLKFSNTFYHSLRFPASSTRHWLPAGLTGTLTTSAQVWLLDGNTVGSEKWIGTADNFALPFRTNNTEKARFLGTGEFLINATTTTAAAEKFQVKTAASAWGFVHTDGTRIGGTYIDATALWWGTYSNHPLSFFTNNGSSRLDITTSGVVDCVSRFRAPRASTATRDAIVSPTSAEIIFNTTTNRFNYYNGGWRILPDTADGLAQFAATTSAQLAGVISDETGSGALVFGTSPTLTTPTLGVASATSINNLSLTPPATSATLTVSDGIELTTPSFSGKVGYCDVRYMASNATTTTTAAGTIGNFTFTIEPNSVYEVWGEFRNGCSGNGGIKYSFDVPGTSTLFVNFNGNTSANTSYVYTAASADATAISNAFCTVNAVLGSRFSGHIVADGTGGTVSMQFQSGTGGQTSTVYQVGSTFNFKRIQ